MKAVSKRADLLHHLHRPCMSFSTIFVYWKKRKRKKKIETLQLYKELLVSSGSPHSNLLLCAQCMAAHLPLQAEHRLLAFAWLWAMAVQELQVLLPCSKHFQHRKCKM